MNEKREEIQVEKVEIIAESTEETNDPSPKAENVMIENVPVETAPKKNRMLYRHPSHSIVGGVCGGIADFISVDPVLVRIGWVVATIMTGGGGFLAYLALMFLLPVGTQKNGQQRSAMIELNERSLGWAAMILIGLGAAWFLSNVGILPALWWGFWTVAELLFWPAVLIGAGFLLLNRGSNVPLRERFSSARDDLRTRFSNRMPSGDEVKVNLKDGVNKAREYVPLRRSRRDRIFLGVCGGIGQKFGIDSNLVRLIWVAISIATWGLFPLIAYGVAALLMPEESLYEVNGVQPMDADVEIV